MSRASGEIDHLGGGLVSGGLRPTDIPLSAAVSEAQYEALLAGDDDRLEVVIEIAPGRSSRGWTYPEAALEKLVQHVQQRSLNGILGHQRDEDMNHQFVTPVTHWVGATWRNGRAYFRGVVDKAAPDLKRWIRAGRVTQPSIFTRPTLGPSNVVIDLEPLGIDWAPLDRAGMSTARVVAWGEQNPGGNTDMDGNAAIGELTAIGGLVGTTPEQARASVASLLHENSALRERARATLGHDVEAEAARRHVPEGLRPLVGELASPKLDAATATPQQIGSVVGEIMAGPAYRAAAAGHGASSTTLNPAVARPHQGSDADMSPFELVASPISPR